MWECSDKQYGVFNIKFIIIVIVQNWFVILEIILYVDYMP